MLFTTKGTSSKYGTASDTTPHFHVSNFQAKTIGSKMFSQILSLDFSGVAVVSCGSRGITDAYLIAKNVYFYCHCTLQDVTTAAPVM